MYHSIPQVIAGYFAGLLFGTTYFMITEYIPLLYPASILGQMRKGVESIWVGIGGTWGWELSASGGGWGEGWVFVGDLDSANTKLGKAT
jgi:dolichyldiphosphatase